MIIRRYDALSIALHWLVALVVIATYAIGLGREILPKGDVRTALLALQMSLSIMVFALTVMRIGWCGFRRCVEPLAGPHWEVIASRATHSRRRDAALARMLPAALAERFEAQR